MTKDITDRTKYIGSSDARDILSGSWDRLYKLKKKMIEPDDLSDNFKVQLGVLTEEFHLDWTVRRHMAEHGDGWKWSKFRDDGSQHFAKFQPDTFDHPPLLVSHPDALIRDPLAKVMPMEVKHTGRFKNADEAADFYMPQIQHHMICWDTNLLLFSVICGNDEPERIWVGASLEWREHYLTECEKFWQHIANNHPPAPAFYDGAKAASVPTKVKDSVPLNGMRRISFETLTEGSNRAPTMIDDFIATKDAVKRHDAVKKEIKDLVPDDVKEVYGERLTIKRDARGAMRFTVHEQKAA